VWLGAKQDKLWNTFEKAYLLDEKYNKWRYNVTNLPGATPSNNSIESMNLVSKNIISFFNSFVCPMFFSYFFIGYGRIARDTPV
jgi:hypothetical protein